MPIESDLIEYFKQYGIVADAIVMRDRQTNRGRGFGFVKMQFENRDKAYENKNNLLQMNVEGRGHMINEKRVDCKSADDFVKPPGGPVAGPGGMGMGMGMGGMPGNPNMGGMPSFNQNLQQQLKSFQNMNQGSTGVVNSTQETVNGQLVNKPNPYVIVEQGANKVRDNKEVIFKYPKSKIFVGGLDFRLTNEELKQHFVQFGEIDSAVILKDINTGQSRGFGFVTFKDEAVAQDLILNLQVTTVNGRKVDIKSAEPK